MCAKIAFSIGAQAADSLGLNFCKKADRRLVLKEQGDFNFSGLIGGIGDND